MFDDGRRTHNSIYIVFKLNLIISTIELLPNLTAKFEILTNKLAQIEGTLAARNAQLEKLQVSQQEYLNWNAQLQQTVCDFANQSNATTLNVNNKFSTVEGLVSQQSDLRNLTPSDEVPLITTTSQTGFKQKPRVTGSASREKDAGWPCIVVSNIYDGNKTEHTRAVVHAIATILPTLSHRDILEVTHLDARASQAAQAVNLAQHMQLPLCVVKLGNRDIRISDRYFKYK